jgi:hypothetical protein
MSGAAVATLGKMMVDQAAPAATRVRAAECIINHAAKAIEIEDIEARVAELERAAESEGSPMRTRTRAGLLTRLERLECRVAANDHTIKLRLGHLKRLPRIPGRAPRHRRAEELPKRGDQEWVEYEEVPGPNPDPPQQLDRGAPRRLDVMFVEPHPSTEEDLEALADQPAQASPATK